MDPSSAEIFFGTHGRLTTIFLAAIGAWQVYRWVSRGRLGVSYGLVWLGVCLALLVVAAFPATLLWAGRLAGTREPEGAMRLAGFVFVAAILLHLSLKTSALERRLEELVQALALRDADLPGTEPEPPRSAPRSDHV